MDVSTQTLIETGLNVIGFLTAAGLWMLLTSRRNRRTETVERASAPKTRETISRSVDSPVDSIETVASSEGADMAFVSFNAPSRVTEHNGNKMSTRREIPSHLKGRAETIRLARQMLVSGSSLSEIKRSLPVTDGELALLQSA